MIKRGNWNVWDRVLSDTQREKVKAVIAELAGNNYHQEGRLHGFSVVFTPSTGKPTRIEVRKRLLSGAVASVVVPDVEEPYIDTETNMDPGEAWSEV